MKLLTYTSTPARDLQSQLGRPEYSYRFVVQEFRPLLRSLGDVIEVEHPEWEVDAIYEACRRHGEECVFLCFMPPNKTPVGLACPTIPVFAWEYEALPFEAFGGKPRNDWRRVLASVGSALTHSTYTVECTRAAMGNQFPIASVPAPLWDRMQSPREPLSAPAILSIDAIVIDSHLIDLFAYRRSAINAALPKVLPVPPGCEFGRHNIVLDGILYTAIFNPFDGRKNWLMMVSAFCEALRDRSDATLLIKLTHHDPAEIIPEIIEAIYKMGPMQCRVVLVHAYLHQSAYDLLLAATTFAVNASHGEGQCLPLMEYMAAGKVAVAPRHTSMRDYIDHDCAFVVDSTEEIGTWPHDPRQIFRTLRQRIHYHSLVAAFRQSYYVATKEPAVYEAMSRAAIDSLRRYCSMEVVRPRLEQSIRERLDAHAANPVSKVSNVCA
ncbi:glycosyltransferase [Dyella sp. RRB7]|uniref:glycosyltransferase n=1 Tax=Dyella sp. RRB7 TaxID=2919502 RepID=UPI001FAAF191|nr:glycosyltransferase [Dyella sp. RRB7]